MKNERNRNIFFVVTMVLMTIYLGWRALFTLPFDQGTLNVIFGVLLIVAETVTVWTTFELFIQKMNKKSGRIDFPIIPDDAYPHVDVFIATHNEPIDILYKTVNACTQMDYPDKNKVHIYLCDDGNRPAVAELAREFGVGYLGLAENTHAKSGNLNNAIAHTSSPLIATFDADMIPQHTFLMKTVPYFLHTDFIEENGIWRRRRPDEPLEWKLGLVQTPQSFYNPDLFQFNLYAEGNIPNEQDFFSKEINTLRNTSNAVAYTGSNAVLSRSAVAEIGGFPTKTITEDFEVSVRMQKEGYIVYATDEVQAAGLTTTTIKSMIRQRTRWARGILQSLQNTNAIFTRKLAISTRITYLNSYLYWWSFFNRFIFIISPILFALFDFQIVNTSFIDLAIFWLPAYFCYSTAMRFLSSNLRNQRWSQVVDTIFMPYLMFPVILETFGIHERTFTITSKAKNTKSTSDMWYAVPHIILLVMSILALIRFTSGKYGWAIFYGSVIIFWLVYNVVALSYAVFFMLGRRSFRSSERIRANEAVDIEYLGRTYQARTEDVSDTGIAFTTPQPIYLPEKESIRLTVHTDRYHAELNGTIVYVRQSGKRWQYSAQVTPLSEEDKRQYTQIIYDRPHSLPTQMNLWVTAYDDMVRNVKKRMEKPSSDKRKLPRVPLNTTITFAEGGSCTVHDFNYQYFSVSNLALPETAGRLTLVTSSGITVLLRRTATTVAGGTRELLEVENLEPLAEAGLIGQVLADLTAAAQQAAAQQAAAQQAAAPAQHTTAASHTGSAPHADLSPHTISDASGPTH